MVRDARRCWPPLRRGRLRAADRPRRGLPSTCTARSATSASSGAAAAVALNPATPVDAVAPRARPRRHGAGDDGQPRASAARTTSPRWSRRSPRSARDDRRGRAYDVDIEVDGGIGPTTVAGAPPPAPTCSSPAPRCSATPTGLEHAVTELRGPRRGGRRGLSSAWRRSSSSSRSSVSPRPCSKDHGSQEKFCAELQNTPDCLVAAPAARHRFTRPSSRSSSPTARTSSTSSPRTRRTRSGPTPSGCATRSTRSSTPCVRTSTTRRRCGPSSPPGRPTCSRRTRRAAGGRLRGRRLRHRARRVTDGGSEHGPDQRDHDHHHHTVSDQPSSTLLEEPIERLVEVLTRPPTAMPSAIWSSESCVRPRIASTSRSLSAPHPGSDCTTPISPRDQGHRR